MILTEDPEAAAFFADIKASLTAQQTRPLVPRIAVDEPDLFDLSGMPDGPRPSDVIVSSWVLSTMQAKLDAGRRAAANEAARRAGECQARHPGAHGAVLSLLAAAEQNAPDADRPWHAARLDAYAAAHGLRGWYRTTDLRGKRSIQVNLVRAREEGDRGRHYVHAAYRGLHGPTSYWVIDRDTGRTAYRAISKGIAQQWIDEKESA